ncbi:DUF1488 domain-containing protein [Photobacterium aquimaris]|uniref:DUF1488 domain-containing protein n=1 Tax=Photobacterium aquimaris TaxID=512643 RepID=A0A1B8I193_9GAMM|nr:DUF1488 domain-containing protein [Photobacterium aquimaris]MCP4955760.1 DUF1488 domain-containing protein [Photobacterium aquimaris]OBU23018.1 transcriptional regulator [Photobacterium aquimaris]PQJ37313.1 transcriptional regulator [Photobacterium aquimaris]PSU04218.1 DUF1488 domain-containing protein [Photobacterium aquimaris]SMY18257.1 hypothetical protein PAQU9191_03598 [Photobacterium aquimaris]
MNQDILFSDIQSWDAVRQAVNFPAQQGGALIICWVTLDWLQQHSGKSLSTSDEIIATFIEYRFDIEDIAEAMIDNEDFNDNGDIVISE